MSVSELPLHLFYQQSSSFCSSIKNDLEELVQQIESEFTSINREVKIAPKLRRKSKLVGTPGACTLDVREFTRSKEHVLHNLKTTFADLEMKWSTDVSGLRNWFLMNVESCLSKIQLELKVTAEELNLQDTGSEENSSSGSEVDNTPVTRQSTTQFLDYGPRTTAAKKRMCFSSIPEVTQQSTTQFHDYHSRTTAAKKRVSFSSVPEAKRPRVQARETINVTKPGFRSRWTDWMSLLGATDEAPSQPGIYEIKQARAKNAAYIGHSDDLQKCFLQYREGKPSRVKHKKQLENFIQRNKGEISVRYEVHPSVQLAKQEESIRLKEFQEKHKKPPTQNYGL